MNPRQRRAILLLVLSALGLIAVFVLVADYVSDVRAEVDPKVNILQLRRPVDQNSAVPDTAVRIVQMPERWAPRNALRDQGQLVGLVAASKLQAGSILQDGMLVSPPELEPGDREIAITVDAETGVAGKVGPGSIVDIVATFGGDQRGEPAESTVVVPGARIIDVGQTQLKGGRGVQGAQPDPTQVVPVTFALNPKEQLRVTYAESFAQEVRLALLRPGESSNLKPDELTYRRDEGQQQP
jgi:pilus assembly protein CpaB